MSDRSTLFPAPQVTGAARAPVSRRTALLGGSAVGALGLLPLGGSDAHAASVHRAAAPGVRRVHLARVRGAVFRGGRRSNVRVADGVLRLPGGRLPTRSYDDPFTPAGAVAWEHGEWISPVIRPGFDLTEAIASWDVDTPGGTWVEVQVRGRDERGVVTKWYVMSRWCRDDIAQGGAIQRTTVENQDDAVATVWTDTLGTLNGHALREVQLRVLLMRRAGTSLTPTVHELTLMSSALPDDATVPMSAPGPARGKVLNVPQYSQEVHAGEYPQWDGGGEAWCSPTSTAMVLDFWRRGPSAAETAWVDRSYQDPQVCFTARATYDYTYDGAGNWPYNTAYAASRSGMSGYVTRLRSLREAEDFIVAGIPLVLSVSFKSSELTGAGYGTNGHLMVLRGFDSAGNPVMNDPASHLIADNAQVRVTYDRRQLENVWVPRSGGTAYVMFPSSVTPPRPEAR